MRTAFALALTFAAAACTHAPRPVAPVAAPDDALAIAPSAGAFVAPPGDALARARELEIERLHAYRVAAVFPTDAAGMPLAVFHDGWGRPCPMAALIEQSGHADLVADVVRTDNTLQLASVKGGPLMNWMLASGLTQEEVALVQGALDITERFDTYESGPQVLAKRRARAHAAVIAKLASVEEVLRGQTQASLAVAVTRAQVADALAHPKLRAAVAANPYE